MRISLVIPVYNEVDRIHDCLTAIAAQKITPYEVIIVDNNSTDGSAIIAATFPFVKILQEPRQGVAYARDRGFNAATGDIIGRIDADTIIPTDWTANVQKLFTNDRLDAVSGAVTYRDIAFSETVSRLDLYWRRRMARLLGREVALQGANMAIRTSAWQTIASEVCHKRGQHEDFDLAIHLVKQNKAVRFDESLKASVCYRQANYDFASFSNYVLISPRTYLEHGRISGRVMYQVVAFIIILYPVISILSRGYDEGLKRFSLRKLFGVPTPARVNPATYVD